jgi:hypothetical protein
MSEQGIQNLYEQMLRYLSMKNQMHIISDDEEANNIIHNEIPPEHRNLSSSSRFREIRPYNYITRVNVLLRVMDEKIQQDKNNGRVPELDEDVVRECHRRWERLSRVLPGVAAAAPAAAPVRPAVPAEWDEPSPAPAAPVRPTPAAPAPVIPALHRYPAQSDALQAVYRSVRGDPPPPAPVRAEPDRPRSCFGFGCGGKKTRRRKTKKTRKTKRRKTKK